ncbi:hypothetical protein CFAM422_006693 [Trichoderma lentiforme]|uniref:Uncharacterized protein n=1 Tax=Trichoderma lentiforme TaxID=1567552 RepID=A0A9P4XEU2_9HYPO|nr:hypothetical protein CFAM422_006693 [Trichoderma lentiforme]
MIGPFITISSAKTEQGISACGKAIGESANSCAAAIQYGSARLLNLSRWTNRAEPFSLEESGIPVCATCRGSLWNIARYGRIVRRAILDESTKKFIAWAYSRYLSLAT